MFFSFQNSNKTKYTFDKIIKKKFFRSLKLAALFIPKNRLNLLSWKEFIFSNPKDLKVSVKLPCALNRD